MHFLAGRPEYLLLAFYPLANAISLDISNTGSIKAASRTTAEELVGLYSGTKPGKPIGLYDEPCQWWESGAVWSGLIDYQAYTSDDRHTTIIQDALLAQIGPNHNYQPPNQTKLEGNDDQGFWALAAVNAAEKNFPTPPSSPAWIDMAKNVFENQASRWDESACGGGLRRQIYTFNQGYDYKNAISQATFFLLAARLAKHTNNGTYVDWANKVYNWTAKVGLIDDSFRVFDGATTAESCGTISRLQWTYNAAAFMYGSAVMYDHSNRTEQWQRRTAQFASAMSVFYPQDNPGIMVEVACEPHGTCDTDMSAFKGLASQWIGATIQAASFTNNTLAPRLRASAVGAAQQCSGGSNGTTCGFLWTHKKWDATSGVGQQLDAMNVLVANLVANGVAANSTTAMNGTQASGSQPVNLTSLAPLTMQLPPVQMLCVGIAVLFVFI